MIGSPDRFARFRYGTRGWLVGDFVIPWLFGLIMGKCCVGVKAKFLNLRFLEVCY